MARYLVANPTGVYIPQIGLIRVGQIFTAPEGYKPARHLKPLDAEALKELEGTYAAHEKHLKAALADVQGDDREAREERRSITNALRELADEHARFCAVAEIPEEKPVVEQGVSMKELGKIIAGTPNEPPKPAGGPKRAADR